MKRITIIGGGASGTLLAINLLKYGGNESIEINLLEKRSSVGHGVAFGTSHDVHLLNVPAGKMGAFPDDVEHFHRWLNTNGHDHTADAFVPRKYFAEYLNATLDDARKNLPSNVVLNLYDVEAVDADLEETHAKVTCAEGDIFYSEAVVLAFGNFLPPHPSVPDLEFTTATKYFQDAWSPAVDTDIGPLDSVLIIGTGLSMADMVMRLADKNHLGRITAISTRGLLPAVHRLGFTHPPFYDELRGKKRITELLKEVRHQIEAAESDSGDWRAVIDSLRPFTQQIWLDLPLSEKRYFKQHLSRYWNAARHRMPPETAAVLAELQIDGRLEILKGRLQSIEHYENFDVKYSFEGAKKTIRADAIINCIGSESNFAKLDAPLVQNLFAKGAVRSDPLNFGLDAHPDGALVGANGERSKFLFTLGTALKGTLWESTAIPEIRKQARDLAETLLQN